MADFNLRTYLQTPLEITPYFLLILPRLFVCLSSFLVDFSLYKICKINREPCTTKLVFLASSYVMFVYGTRTFSNTVEMVLVSLLLYLVAESQAYSRDVIQRYEYLSERYRKAKAAAERARFYKLKLLLPSHSMRHSIAISLLTVAGVFNRPTFVVFAMPPVFFWLHRGLGSKSVNFATFHLRMFVFVSYSSLAVCLFVLMDSIYFGHISGMELMHLDVSINNFVVTPLNFVRYNLDARNLAQHGLHSRTLHVLVNVPLLYNVLGLAAIYGIFILFYRVIMGEFRSLPQIYSIEGLMTTSILAPVIALSYFPHQEARFLIPVTLPIVLLYSDRILRKNSLCKLWISLNLFCLLFYGFVHQAGLYPAAVHLSRDVRESEITMKPIHLVTSHVYSLPLSLMRHRNTKMLYTSGFTKYQRPNTFFLQEMGSTSLKSVAKHLNVIHQIAKSVERRADVYLLLPTSKFCEMRGVADAGNITLQGVRDFYPHISTEAMPDVVSILTEFLESYSVFNLLSALFGSCGLGLYKVHRNVSLI